MASSLTGFTLAAQGISLAKSPTPARSVPLPPDAGAVLPTAAIPGPNLDLLNVPPPGATVASSAAKIIQLRYPNTDWPSNQDHIIFTARKYGKRDFKIAKGSIGFEERIFEDISPTVCLPIQSKITDQNSVGWTDSSELNAIQIGLSGLSMAAITSDKGLTQQESKQLIESAGSAEAKRFFQIYFAGKAASAQGLLSRLTGSIANPNLELLFQGPSLRPFTFNFIMSARDEAEATRIRRIIRFFKQNMAVQRTESNIFLKSPNIFKVQYKSSRAKGGLHPSINRIKNCALQALNIDYTPAGTYSTFNDAKSTMTAYTMGMSFTELEPVFADEYKEVPIDEIGF